MIRPEEFGAAGDGHTDDTRAIQAALDRADGGTVLLGGRVYATSATLVVPSGTRIDGTGATIRARADDTPVLVSQPWARPGAPLRGRTRIAGLRIEASGRGTRQDGIVLHDFWSAIEDCEIVAPGGRGIVMTATDRAGTPASSTLVENRVRRCIVREAAGSCFWLGEPANGKLTDCELSGCIASQREGADAPAVTIGHAAGWTVRDLHTYGGRPTVAVEIRQAYFTRIAGLYIESFGQAGLALLQVQTSVSVSDVQIAVEQLGQSAAFLALSAHRDYPAPVATFSGVTLTAFRASAGVVLRSLDGRVRMEGAPTVVAAPGSPAIARGDAAAAPRRVERWRGRAHQEIELADLPAEGTFGDSRVLALAARADDGALVSRFAGMLTWSRADAGGGASVDLVPFGPPVGFTEDPDAALIRRGDRLALVLRFTPVASGEGTLSLA